MLHLIFQSSLTNLNLERWLSTYDGDATTLSAALVHINFLETQFERLWKSIKILQDHEGLTNEAEILAWPDTNRQDLPGILERLDHLLYEFGWIQNSVQSLQEHTSLEEGYYAHLPYQWEGPLLQTF